MPYKKPTIMIDLDGVLNEYKGEFNADQIPCIKKDAKNFLEKLSENYQLKLFTSRNLLLSAKWLIKNKIDNYFTDICNVKIPAFVYIDDRTINFDGDYDKIINEVQKFKPYWKS